MLFLIALQFLTIIPISLKEVTDDMLARSMIFFPVVGLLIGGIQALVFWGWRTHGFTSTVIALFLVLIPIILTGALHIEGFADMIDGFSGGHNKNEILQIMRDGRIGAIGAVSVACLILTKFVLLKEVIENLPPWLVIKVLLTVFCLSRWSMVICAGISRYADSSLRSERQRVGRPFIELVGMRIVALASIIPVASALILLNLPGIIGIGFVGVVVFIISRIAVSKITGITGDILGGINEITEIALLLSVAILIK